MRIVLASALLCALAAPAFALPPAPFALSAPVPLVPVKSKGKAVKGKAAKAKCAPGAICPLVGGGDY